MGTRAPKTGYYIAFLFVCAMIWAEQYFCLGKYVNLGSVFHKFCNLSYAGNPNLVMALAANKADLDSKRKIEAEV
jgi:hypothetical protein